MVVDILETPRIMRAKLEPKSNFHAAIMSHHRLWLWYVVWGMLLLFNVAPAVAQVKGGN